MRRTTTVTPAISKRSLSHATRRGAALVNAIVEAMERRTLFSTLVVNSAANNTTAGDGLVTLHEAIDAANNDAITDTGQTGSGADTITFDLGPGAHTIDLDSPLPALGQGVVIQGPGA